MKGPFCLCGSPSFNPESSDLCIYCTTVRLEKMNRPSKFRSRRFLEWRERFVIFAWFLFLMTFTYGALFAAVKVIKYAAGTWP